MLQPDFPLEEKKEKSICVPFLITKVNFLKW